MRKRVLIVNVYFAPNSFGGATVIAEEMAQRLADQHGWSVSGFASMRVPGLPDFVIRRYRARSTDVVAINVPAFVPYTEQYCSPRVRARFAEVLEAFGPDVVHLHSVQTLGADLLDATAERGIPAVVTLHDSWWLCDRQFMIDSRGHYCFQQRISLDRCRYCVNDIRESTTRFEYLLKQLHKADLLLFPSSFQRQLYVSNGLPEERCIVNKNGVRPPTGAYRRRQAGGNPVFGFIGGPGALKGGDLIVSALRELGRPSARLRVVDAAQNVGATWQNSDYWDVPGMVEHVPAYRQDTIDEFFSSIDVLLFPSQVKESFGLTVREALLRDVWVVATDAGGVAEDMRDGENATLIPMNGDSRPLVQAMAALMERNDWPNYRNPHKATITTLDEQAAELSTLLARAID